jgi:hypothetical protein
MKLTLRNLQFALCFLFVKFTLAGINLLAACEWAGLKFWVNPDAPYGEAFS